jgi:Protein of unknown function (DUF3987)
LAAWPHSRPLYSLDKLVANPSTPVVVTEGEKAADAAMLFFPKSIATTSSGGAGAASRTDWTPLTRRRVLVWPDSDEPGRKYAREVAAILAGLGCTVEIIDPAALVARIASETSAEPFDVEKAKSYDAADALADWPDVAALREAVAALAAPLSSSWAPSSKEWADPKPISDGLSPVAAFDFDFRPGSVAAWVADIADRMQCPPDSSPSRRSSHSGAVLGRKVAIRPQRRTDWTEVPNLWGCIVGRPGMWKSPAMAEALKSLHRLERGGPRSARGRRGGLRPRRGPLILQERRPETRRARR